MDYFRKLPGFHRAATGLEWRVLKMLPLVTLLGLLIPAACVFLLRQLAWLDKPDIDRIIMMTIGWSVLYCTVMTIVAIAAFIVMVMKGPAYVADPYYPPDFNEPDDKIDRFPR